MSAAPAPLAGLLLAGGQSARMQRDKAALEYAGEPQLARAFRLLAAVAGSAFVAVRPEQAGEPLRRAFPQLEDAAGLAGPIAGIVAAQCARPDHAWLVLAVDLPRLDATTLERLLAARDPAALATAYASAGPADSSGLPEPLCAIWEPASAAPLAAFAAGGGRCPRKFLLTHGVRLVPLADPRALDNVNTPDEYRAARGDAA